MYIGTIVILCPEHFSDFAAYVLGMVVQYSTLDRVQHYSAHANRGVLASEKAAGLFDDIFPTIGSSLFLPFF